MPGFPSSMAPVLVPRLHRQIAEIQTLGHCGACVCQGVSLQTLVPSCHLEMASPSGGLHGLCSWGCKHKSGLKALGFFETKWETSRLKQPKTLQNSSCQFFLCCNNNPPSSCCLLGLAFELLQAHRGGRAAGGGALPVYQLKL